MWYFSVYEMCVRVCVCANCYCHVCACARVRKNEGAAGGSLCVYCLGVQWTSSKLLFWRWVACMEKRNVIISPAHPPEVWFSPVCCRDPWDELSSIRPSGVRRPWLDGKVFVSFFQVLSRCRVYREEVCVCQFQGQADAFSSLLFIVICIHCFDDNC